MILWIMLFCAMPTCSGFLYSLVPEEIRTPISFALFIVIELYLKWQALANIMFDLLFMEIEMLVTSHWIKILK